MITENQYTNFENELKKNNSYPNRRAFRTAFDSIMGTLLVEKDFEKIERLKFSWLEKYREFNIEKTDQERIEEWRAQNPVSKLIRR